MLARLIVQTLVSYAIIGLVLFLGAGTMNWPSAWFFLLEMVVVSVAGGLWLLRHDPDLVGERLAPPIQPDQPTADKVVTSLLLLAFLASLWLIAVDAVRFEWSSVPPLWRAIGEGLVALSLWIGFRSLRENSFAAPVVKVQTEREQTVVATGPYKYVRHPMYAGALLFSVGTSLLLGSWWGILAGLGLAILLAVRIRIEETALRGGLAGYAAYAVRVRYRLCPGIW